MKPHRWTLGITGIWIGLTLGLIARSGLTNLLVTTLFFGAAIVLKRWQHLFSLRLEPDRVDRGLAILLLGLAGSSSLILPSDGPWVRFLPLLSVLSLGLWQVGRSGLSQLWRELLLFLVLAIPLEQLVQPLNQFTSLTTVMAQFSNFALWYVGFDTTRQGETIFLDHHPVWVGPNCTGIVTILWMLQLALLVLYLYPTRWHHKLLLPIGAIATVLLFNGLIRIPLLVVLAAYNPSAFEIVHSDRMEILSTLPILMFGGFCYGLLRRSPQPLHRRLG